MVIEDDDIIALENQRKELREQLHKAKEERDKLNQITSDLRKKKMSILDEIHRYRKEGSMHRERRDEINKNVARAKKMREKLNTEYEKLRNELKELKKKYLPEGPSLESLRKKRDDLEFRQMTQQLSKREEEKLIEELAKLNKEIKEREKILESNEELRELIKKEEELKIKSDKEHQKVQELADRAQKEHIEMMECFKKASRLQKELKKIEKEYIMNKLNADKAHRDFISYIKKIREIEERIREIREKEKKFEIQKEKDVIMKKADEIYQKFKKGEKLSTEDLLLLQKAGLI